LQDLENLKNYVHLGVQNWPRFTPRFIRRNCG